MSSNPANPKSKKERPHDEGDGDDVRSASLIEQMITNIQLEESLNPKLTLKRFLSIRSVVSTSSSFAERQQAAVGTVSAFRRIGAGTCGNVYEIPGTVDIFKVAKHPGQSTDQLWNDFKIHMKVSEVFDKIGRHNLEVHVPRIKYFVSMNDEEFWGANMRKFPPEDQNISNLLCAERILPLPKQIRESLVDEFCPLGGRAMMKASELNKDCLVRLYLGKRREAKPTKFFQLRNFTMYLDQMESLDLDYFDFANHIADALAVMHWGVGVDANDVEFVLGSAPDRIANPSQIMPKTLTSKQVANMPENTSTWASHLNDFRKRITHIWMLDFNRCSSFSHSQSGITQLVDAFFRNDPYFPRPHAKSTKDQQLWATFRDRYLNTSKKLVHESVFPKRFIDMVVEEQRQRMEARTSLEA